MAEQEGTAVPSSEDTGDKTYTQAEVDALVNPEVEKRKDAERASTKHGERAKALEADLASRASDKDFQRAMLSVLAQGRGESEEELETSAKPHEDNIRVAKERCLRRLKERRLTQEDD